MCACVWVVGCTLCKVIVPVVITHTQSRMTVLLSCQSPASYLEHGRDVGYPVSMVMRVVQP